MKCKEVRSLIDQSSSQELRDADTELRAHIDSCASCSRVYELRRITSQSLVASAGGVRAGRRFTMRVLDALDREAGWSEPPRARKQMSWRAVLRPSPAWAALALVLVMISGYNYLRTMGYFHPTGEVPINMGRFVEDVGHDATCSVTAASRAANGAVQPTMPPWAAIMASAACLKLGK